MPTSVGLWTKLGSIYFCFIDHTEVFIDHNILWKILKKMGVSDHILRSPKKPVCKSRSNR